MISSCLEGVGRSLREGLTIFWVNESEAREVEAAIEVVERVVEGCGGRVVEEAGAADTLPFAPTVDQTLLLLSGGGGDIAAS